MNLTKQSLAKQVQNLQEYFKQYPKQIYQKQLEKLLEHLNNKIYKISIVGNMSAGKSSFINALFGKDLLPTANEATTDCGVYIYLKADERYAKVYFEDRREKILQADEIHKIQEYAKKDEYCDVEYRGVKSIELFYPINEIQSQLKNIEMDFDLCFIDTPGPNNQSQGGQKHADRTQKILQNADLVLFLFDYGQFDASTDLEDTEKEDAAREIWREIQKRKEAENNKNEAEKKYFECFFLLNKLDLALNDFNKALEKLPEEKWQEEARKKWYQREKENLNKLKNAAKKHNFQNPLAFGLCSLLQYLKINDNINRQAKKPYNEFKNTLRDIFDESYEKELIEYLGFDKLHKEINEYLKTKAIENILKPLQSRLNSIKNEEKQDLQREISLLEKPSTERKESINKAEKFLKNEALKLQQDLNQELEDLKNAKIEKLEHNFDEALNIFKAQVDAIVARALCFLHNYAEGQTEQAAKKLALSLDDETEKQYLSRKTIKIVKNMVEKFRGQTEQVGLKSIFKFEIEHNQEQNDEKEEKAPGFVLFENFIKELLCEGRREFFDIQSAIKNLYIELNQKSTQSLEKYKFDFDLQLNKELDIPQIKEEKVEFDEYFDDNMDFLTGALNYRFEKAQTKTESETKWWNPFTWGQTRTVILKPEGYFIDIKSEAIIISIKEQLIEKTMQKDIEEAKQKHRQNITQACEKNKGFFEELRSSKEQDIAHWTEERSNMESKITELKQQVEDLKKLGENNE